MAMYINQEAKKREEKNGRISKRGEEPNAKKASSARPYGASLLPLMSEKLEIFLGRSVTTTADPRCRVSFSRNVHEEEKAK